MNERYSKLFSLPENLYTSGSPVVIAAGALLKDNQTGKIIAQLKICNISPKLIKAAKVSILPFDTVGNPLGEKVEYMYLDLKVSRDETFAQKTPVALPDNTTRSFSASVSEVIFADNSVWQASEQLWEVLSPPVTLESVYNDSKLIKQYRIKFGADCKYILTEQKDLWYCACGSLNHNGETVCHRCQKNAESLLNVDSDILKYERDNRIKGIKKLATICAAVVALVIAFAVVFVVVLNYVVIPTNKYNDAIALMDAGKHREAIAVFEVLDGYRDSDAKLAELYPVVYNDAVSLKNSGRYVEAAMVFGAIGKYQDAEKQSIELWDKIAVRETISAGFDFTIGLKTDGTVVAAGYNGNGLSNVSGWNDIIAISAGQRHIVGLKADGTVVAVGSNGSGQCNVSGWKDIVAISAGLYQTIGLKADGTVVTTHSRYNVSDWKDIIAISAGGGNFVVGLKADGTAVASALSYMGADRNCNVSDWKDIVAISAGGSHTVGLKADGTVVAVGPNYNNQCNVSGWKDIVAISAGEYHTVGLKADGTVVAVGEKTYGRCDVSGWKDIVAISAGRYQTIGLKADGTVVSVGGNLSGERNVSDWKNIKVPENG